MNQLIAFFAPTTLPNAAGAGVRAQGVSQGDAFAAVLAQVQATVSGEPATAPDATEQLAQLVGQLPPGLVQAVKSLSTDDVAEQLEAVAAPNTHAPQLDALLATLLQTGQAANTTQAPADVAQAILDMTQALPAESPVPHATSSTLGAVLQAFHAQAGTPPAAVPAPSDVPAGDIGLRGSLGPEQPAVDNPAQSRQAASDVVETVAAQLALPANLARPRSENRPQHEQTERSVASLPKRDAHAQLVEGAADQPPQGASPTSKAPDAPAVSSPAQPSTPGGATSAAPAPSHAATPAAATSGNPAAVPAPALPTLVDAQQMSVTLATAPHQPVPLEALAVHIARKFQAGVSQFEIRLHPAELGQLDISLSVADDGHVTAVLRAERPETLDLLQRDARSLETQLRQAGLDVTSNSLNFSLSSGNGQRQTPFTGWPGFADAQGAQNAAKHDAVSTYIAVRRPDGLDIRV